MPVGERISGQRRPGRHGGRPPPDTAAQWSRRHPCGRGAEYLLVWAEVGSG